jgi:hypothetical protein
MRGWRNWQTHYLEVVAGATPWRFKSSPAHIISHARLAQLVEHILDVNGVIGSSPIARTMEKKDIKDIESKQPDELWNEIDYLNSREGALNTFQEVMDRLFNHPDLYYLEINKDRSAMVKKRADGSVIYRTEVLAEVETLEKLGVGK